MAKNYMIGEIKLFLSHPREMRILLIANFVYAAVLPVIWAFVGVYIMRNTENDVRLVMCYSLASYTGGLITFFLNGYFLRVTHVKYLYSSGMLISALSLFVMVSLKKLDAYDIMMAGTLLGFSTGLFWANRNYLSLSSTTDKNRNYYYGLENFLATLCSVIIPISVGWFIAGSQLYGWFEGNRNHAYFFVALGTLLLAIFASIIVCQGRYKNPKFTKFFYLKYHFLWRYVLLMDGLRGIGHGFMITAPAMLTVKLLGGEEGALGIINTGGAILLAIIFYAIARLTGPEHRIWILLVGLSLFSIGCIFNALFFSTLGVLAFITCQIISSALMECSFFPVNMLVIDLLSKKEQRNKFSYLLSSEFPLYIGRLTGILLFMAASIYISDYFALRYVLLLVALIQFCSYFVCKRILSICNEMDTKLTKYDLCTEPHSIADIMFAEER